MHAIAKTATFREITEDQLTNDQQIGLFPSKREGNEVVSYFCLQPERLKLESTD